MYLFQSLNIRQIIDYSSEISVLILILSEIMLQAIECYSTYTEKRLASETCIIDNRHCIVFSFKETSEKCIYHTLKNKNYCQ